MSVVGIPSMPKHSPNAIDRHVGARIRMQRMVRGMSQSKIGNAVGVSFQQVQKYENGTNRIGASRLQQIANVLKVTPDFFFEGAPTSAVVNPDSKASIIQAFISSRDGIALAQAFTKISDANLRRCIVLLVERIAQV